MDILGIGPMELILILIVALAVFGPDKLPGIGAKLGRAMRDMRKATRAFSQEIDSAREALEGPVNEIRAPIKEMQGLAQGASEVAAAVRNPGEAIRKSVVGELTRTDEVTADAAAGEPSAGDGVAEAPVNQAPVADAPVTDATEADAPVADAHLADAHLADAPAADAPVAEAPDAETPVSVIPAGDALIVAPAPEAPDADPPAESTVPPASPADPEPER